MVLQKKKLIVPSFVLALLVWVLMGLGAYRQGRENIEAAQWVDRTYEVLGELNGVLSLMQDVETSTRGYIITGEESYLEPYNNATPKIEPTIQNLRRLTADDPEQPRRLQTLEPLIAQRVALSEKYIAMRKAEGHLAAEQAVSTDEGKRIMDEIRGIIAEMQVAENQLLQHRTEELRASNLRMLAFFLLLFVLLAAFLIAALFLVRRNAAALQRGLELTEKSRAYAQNIVDTVREPLVVLDAELRALSANRSFYQAFRVTPQETEGKPFYELENGQWDIPNLRRLLEEILPQHTTFQDFEVKSDFSGIGQRTMLLNARKMYRVGNNTETILLAIEDVTERRRADEEHRHFFMLSRDLICIAGFDGYFKVLNPAWEETLGYSTKELLASPFLDFIHPDDREATAAEARRLSEGFDTVFFHNRYRCKDGSYKWLSWTSASSVAHQLIYGVARDVTDRKRAEQEMRETRDFLDAVVDNAPMMIFVKDAEDFHFVRVNRACEELLGHSRAELIGKSDHDFFPKAEADFFIAKDNEVLQGGILVDIPEEQVQTRLRGVRTLHTRKVPLLGADGRLRYLLGISEDITQLKQAEAALRRSHEELQHRFAAAIRASGQLHYMRDPRTNAATYRNTETALGYTEEEMAGGLSRWLELVHSDDRDGFRAAIQESLQSERPLHLEYRVRRKAGEFIHVEDRGYLARDEEGNILGVIGFVADISDRKQMEFALRASEEKFAKAFRSSPMAIMISQLSDGRLLEVNDGFSRMTGYAREEVVGRSTLELDLYADPADRARVMSLLSQKGYFRDMEANFRTKSGGIRNGLGAGELIELGSVRCLISVVVDVTEQKQMEEQFRQAQKMEAVGRLAGGVAHDFNNLLGVIIGFSDLLKDRIKGDDTALKYVGEVLKAGDSAARLTRQLLAFSRKQVLEPRVLNLNDIISDMGKMLHRLIGEDIKLITVAAPDLGRVKADPGQIEQVILNLAVNARDAMPQGGKLVIETSNTILDETYARAHISVTPGRYVMLCVSDNGMGMDAETRLRIFEPFFTTKKQGTGLGLATVYGIVKQSGGNIWVYSETGKGTAFKIYLPRVDSKAEMTGGQASSDKVSTGTETILLVEDSESLRAVAREYLERAGYTVVEAPDGNEAVRVAEQCKATIHLLLTDVVMPGMSGRDVAEHVKRHHTGIKVLYMSGYTDDAIVHHGVLEEGVALLAKPFAGESLVLKVRQILDSHG